MKTIFIYLATLFTSLSFNASAQPTSANAAWQWTLTGTTTNGMAYSRFVTEIGVCCNNNDGEGRLHLGFAVPDVAITKAALVIPVMNGAGPTTGTTVYANIEPRATAAVEGSQNFVSQYAQSYWTQAGPNGPKVLAPAAGKVSVNYGGVSIRIPLNAAAIAALNAARGKQVGFGVYQKVIRVEVPVRGEDPKKVNQWGYASRNWHNTNCAAAVGSPACARLELN